MFDQLRYVLTSLGRRLNFGISGRCSAAGARHQEGVTIHIGRDNGESLVEILQQPCENFRRNIEARGLKAVEPLRRECRGRTDVDQGAMAARDKSGNLDALRGHRRFVDQCVAAGFPSCLRSFGSPAFGYLVSTTSTLPRVAREYGHTSCAASTNSRAIWCSIPGRLMLRRAARPSMPCVIPGLFRRRWPRPPGG
jgi:hypothetical protein